MAEAEGFSGGDSSSCDLLLQHLQRIWDEVGESSDERDKMLLQLEQECLNVYRRKVSQAEKSRADLLQSLEDEKEELTRLLSSLGEESKVAFNERSSGTTIKEQLVAIAPVLENLWKQKENRVKDFHDVQAQIQKINLEISGASDPVPHPVVDESDLSLKKLEEFKSQLDDLQQQKSERLCKVLELVTFIRDVCGVLGVDFLRTIMSVDPSLNQSGGSHSKSISNDTLSRLAKTVNALIEDKKKRLAKLQELGSQLIDLWNLMDTRSEERSLFDHVTCHVSASVDEVVERGALTIELLQQAEGEVERLDELKASRMKEIALKKQGELEEVFGRAHIEIDSAAAREKIMGLIDRGDVDHTELLAEMDSRIGRAKEESQSRREILDKVEKWMSACEEESWLDDYNRDENRYNASRGAHLNLKRAERARLLVNKIPSLLDVLVVKTRAWEEERDASFVYDGVPLLAMLDEYAMLRQDREEERRRMRDQRKYHDQLNTEQESMFGSRPSPARLMKKAVVAGGGLRGGASNGGTPPVRRLSLNAHQNGNRSVGGRDGGRRESMRPVAPVNYVAISKDDASSHISSSPRDSSMIPISP